MGYISAVRKAYHTSENRRGNKLREQSGREKFHTLQTANDREEKIYNEMNVEVDHHLTLCCWLVCKNRKKPVRVNRVSKREA